MTTQQDYETLYGVGLLDDLHNYFPAILYDSGRFHNVSELLTYIQSNARNRFDLFSFGQRAYISRHAPPPAPTIPSRAPRTRISATLSSLIAPLQTSIPASVPHIDLSGNHIESDTEEESNHNSETEDSHELPPLMSPSNSTTRERQFQYLADPLSDNQAMNLINLLIGGLNTTALPSLRTREINLDLGSIRLPSQFMEPVIVRPTQEQIEAGSTRAFPSEVSPCSICQEDIQINEMGRRLTACGHTFHIRCIDRWFNENVHCPICRHDIRETNTTNTSSQS